MTVSGHWAPVGYALVGLLWVATARPAVAQVDRRDIPFAAQPQQRFDSGQDVQPIFEGWERNDDGSLTFHFGYLNRNYREQPSVPIGSDNHFSPGAPDRGQPTYFYPRTHRFQFTVQVPGDMGTAFADGLVWTVTHNGSEQRAVGWLQPEWEIDEDTIIKNEGIGFGRPKTEWQANRPPRVMVEAALSVTAVGEPLVLSAIIEDDARPTELPPREEQLFLVPAFMRPDGAPGVPDNIPWYRRPRPPRNGLSVLWVVYRGPSGAMITPPDFQRAVSEDEPEPTGTQARRYPSVGPRSKESTALAGDGWTSATFEATVTFQEPGTYTLRAYACDSMRMTVADVTITVHGARPGQ